ncbi:MAG: hypothetical protein JSW00_09725 [Thermoplasmata archaeon]|nr:MAG: hypothetical protein JSW00_09725 [Thermoplasmata archaeon]
MRITKLNLLVFLLVLIGVVIIVQTAMAWNEKPVAEDHTVFMPGTQPGNAGTFQTVDKCDNCHGGYNPGVEPAHTWRGSMMAQSARDPLWLACLTVSGQDAIWAVGNPNAQDICIRCHSPVGWLEGRSEPTNTAGLQGKDYDGVQCDFCHRMVDPLAGLRQPDVPAEIPGTTAYTMAEETYQRDIEVLSNHRLYDATSYLNPSTNLPTYYGDGSLPNYIEATSGQYFVDPSANNKRGPFSDPKARHGVYYSRFHQSKSFCATCHDVSNPVLASALIGPDVPEKQAAASYFHVERTNSEFLLSDYGSGGSATNIPGVPWADTCQDCHMRDVTGMGCNKKGAPTRDDLPLHDLTGGNAWISNILATTDQSGPVYDPYNYAILSGQKYQGAQIDVTGLQGHGQALVDGSNRAIQQLEMAANLSIVSETDTKATIRVQNNGGHKLISGFPEGRRMFLNVKFYDVNGNLISEINPYESLVTTQDGSGNEVYVSGGVLTKTHEELVWECEMSSNLTGETKSFHFALATDRYKDNRIPPKGFDTSGMYDRHAQPRWEGQDAPDYFTAAEYAGGYDEVTVIKPTGTVTWYATLYYQTTSKEYIEFLRDEINGVGGTLVGNGAGGDPPYIIQTDPFFANLKGWGDAIWDLWLHNGGAEPVLMEQVGQVPAPPCTIDPPTELSAKYVKKGGGSIELTWIPVDDAEGYNVYYFQNEKYTFIASSTSIKYLDKNVIKGQTYTYVVTSYKTCPDGSTVESDYSNTAFATAG